MYELDLCYGYVSSDSDGGIYHAFELVDPKSSVDEDEIVESLADLLDTASDAPEFSWDWMSLKVPESLVKRIQADAERNS